MALTPGTRLGPYEVGAQLGVGGMGEVYRATDTNLGRQVAIKVLPEAFAQDADRLARFEREAQTLASLNNPHIAQIYGLERTSGVSALVMELVEGLTLAERIAQGAIPVGEALPLAKQIAEALEAAHEQGIVHRDLKPANIKVRPDGTVKVLDFGLAKPMAPPGPSPAVSQSPTIPAPAMTQAGVILGTAAYMSPEQARGKQVDRQTDIWAFGCVLFEMLSGRPPFAGETISDTIGKILEREPDWQALPPFASARIRDLLRRCLHKDQERRLHDIADARIEIEEARTAQIGRRRVVAWPVVAAGTALAITLLAGIWWYASRSIPSVQHEPVSVLIADLENRTNDPTFDRVLEPVLKLALEGASFISAYDRNGIARILGVRPPEKLDERAALELAVRQGLGVVLSGSLDRQGSGYGVSVKATLAVTGDLITSVTNRAANRDEVVGVAMNLASAVREALGDDTSEAAQRFATQTFSATSLEVVREYALAAEASSQSKFEDALQGFSRAVALDPNFGLGHAGMAIASRNLRRQQDAENYIKEAVRHLDGMTERERYRTRGLFYYITGDYPACVKEYGDLIARYAADAPARNNLALCLTFLRELPKALSEMQQVIKILPRRALYRENLALYADYSGDFRTGETEARAIGTPTPFGLLALAFAQLLQGQLSQATETYEQMGKMDEQAASMAAAGFGDLALYEGRFSDAARIFAQGADADLASKDSNRAAAKFAALAYTRLLQQQKDAAIAAAERALVNSKTVKIRFLAALLFVEAGEIARARTLAASLGPELQAEPQAYAKIIDGEAALKNGDARQAIKLLIEANSLLDTWIGHFALGRAYLAAGAFTQADSEFDRCIARRGEALALFLDEEPTYGYLPMVYYYQGRVREGLNTAGFVESYRTYLRIRETAGEDPLLAEVRRRTSGSTSGAP